jgi:hypothetical protein
LRLSDAEFLRETPYSLDLLMKRAKNADFKFFNGFAKVQAIIANVNRDPEKKREPFTEFDFMPSYLLPKKKLGRKPGETVEQMRERVRSQITDIFATPAKKKGKRKR